MPDEPSPPPRPHARRRLVVAGVALGVLVIGVAVVAVLWIRGTARPVTLEETREPTGSTLPAAPAVLRPPQGVYLYSGGGTDSLDKPPKEQAEGPDMPATVTHRADGCWTFRIDYSTNHWQSWDYCPRNGGLDEAGGTSYQKWDFGVFVNETTSTFVCDSAVTIKAGQEPGDTWTQSCRGTSTGTEGEALSAGPYRYIGTEGLDVGGEEVRAHRYHRQRTMSGAQTGTESADVWFSAETGMPLRNERRIEAKSSTIIGDVSYTEVADFHLTGLQPEG